MGIAESARHESAVIMSYRFTNSTEAEVYGLMNKTAPPEDARLIERTLCQEIALRTIERLYGDMKLEAAHHIVETYPGWTLMQTWEEAELGTMARVEKDLTAWEV